MLEISCKYSGLKSAIFSGNDRKKARGLLKCLQIQRFPSWL